MKRQTVEYYSGADKVRALWLAPEHGDPVPVIIQGPGWLGLKDAKDYQPYHSAFVEAGFGVLAIDYRGFGESEGERGIVNPTNQLEDLVNGVTYLTTRDDVIAGAIGAYATGGTGGGNVVMLAARDQRVRAVVSQMPVADGEDWLHRMRTEHQWIDFLSALEHDRRQRVRTGASRLVHPRNEIMVQTPERVGSDFKRDVDKQLTMSAPLSMVDPLLHYRPADAARGLRTPLMVVAVENDTTTPTDHARAIYDAAVGPKKYLLQRETGHYEAYRKYGSVVIPHIVEWFRQYLNAPEQIVIETHKPQVH